MIIIGEKINGAIQAVAAAISARDDEFIRQRATDQDAAGADFIDCAPSTATDLEYDAMNWLVDNIQAVTDKPLCLDSPNVKLLARLLEEGRTNRPGMINSVNEEGDKCEVIFPMIAGTDWNVIGLTCDQNGIPTDTAKKIEIAKSMIDKADRYGVALGNLHIDPCVMSLPTMPTAMVDLADCIRQIHEYAPEVKVTAALSNISFDMPVRKYVNMGCMAYAVQAGIDSAIIDPCNADIIGIMYASDVLCGRDKGGRKYNRAYRAGKIGKKK